jgi:hypothetical protein
MEHHTDAAHLDNEDRADILNLTTDNKRIDPQYDYFLLCKLWFAQITNHVRKHNLLQYQSLIGSVVFGTELDKENYGLISRNYGREEAETNLILELTPNQIRRSSGPNTGGEKKNTNRKKRRWCPYLNELKLYNY